MSATRDKSQKITFVYSNLYSIYRKGIERAREGAVESASQNHASLAAEALTQLALGRNFNSGAVIKAADLRKDAQGDVPGLRTESPAPPPQIRAYTPAELLGKRIARPASLPAAAKPASASSVSPVESLKENLKSLNDLQARLRFMLKELEDLIKE